MSLSVHVVAIREVSRADYKIAEAALALYHAGFPLAGEVLAVVRDRFGVDDIGDLDVRDVSEGCSVEVPVSVDGDVMYGDGAKVCLADLPGGTTYLRVYASC